MISEGVVGYICLAKGEGFRKEDVWGFRFGEGDVDRTGGGDGEEADRKWRWLTKKGKLLHC